MSERYERLVEAINVTAVGYMRKSTKFKIELNSQDPRIINARESITSVHKSLCKKTYSIEMLQMYKVLNDEEL